MFYLYTICADTETEIFSCFFFFLSSLAKTRVVWCGVVYALCVYGNESNCLCFCSRHETTTTMCHFPFYILYILYIITFLFIRSFVQANPAFLPLIDSAPQIPYIFTTGSWNEIIFTRIRFLFASFLFFSHFAFKFLFIHTMCRKMMTFLSSSSHFFVDSFPFLLGDAFSHLYNLYLGP